MTKKLVFLLLVTVNAHAITVNGPISGAALEGATSDPTGVSGRMYFNTDNDRMRLYANSAWQSSFKEPYFVNYRNSGSIGTGTSTAAQVYPAGTSTGSDLNGSTLNADIPCASTEVASGDTCTGDEHYGVSFVAPYAGTVEVCIQTHFYTGAMADGEDANDTFYICKTPNDATTCDVSGHAFTFAVDNVAGEGLERRFNFRVCSTFSVAAERVTFRLWHDALYVDPGAGGYVYYPVFTVRPIR